MKAQIVEFLKANFSVAKYYSMHFVTVEKHLFTKIII